MSNVPPSLVFESEMLMPFEVPLSITRTVLELEQRIGKIGKAEEFLGSYIHRFQVTKEGKFTGEFVSAGDKRKRQENRRYLTVEVAMDPFSCESCIAKVQQIKRKVIPSLIQLLESRFSEYESGIYKKMLRPTVLD